jgi:hypothetical protein
MIYEILTVGKNQTQDGVEIIKRTDEDGQVLWIPIDTSNSDYQAYLAQLDKE